MKFRRPSQNKLTETEATRVIWFWRFIAYSFCGFLLEVAFARLIHHPKRDRKCFILLPLCPVYGLGAVLILFLTELLSPGALGVMVIGFFAATAAEYFMALFYEKALGVQFWDYSALPLNLHGRVCPTFSLCWAGLSLGLVYWVAPRLNALLLRLSPALLPPAMILLLCDGAVSAVALRRTGTPEVLRWYR